MIKSKRNDPEISPLPKTKPETKTKPKPKQKQKKMSTERISRQEFEQ
jgi:hypothetical protein